MSVALPVLVWACVFAAAALALEKRETLGVRRRVAAYVDPRRAPVERADAPAQRLGAELLSRVLAATETRLRRLPSWDRLEALVERSGLRLQPVELVYVALGGALLLALTALALGAPPLGVAALPAAGLAAGWAALAVRIDRRRRAFEEQLPELLGSLASALRVGHGFQQALQAAAADAPEPTAGNLARVLAEMRLGRPPEDALAALGRRVGSPDLDFVLDAVLIQRQVGGSLAGIFEIVAESLRRRQQFALRIRALTATGRLSVLVLVALPVALALLLTLVDRTYLAPLLDTRTGRLMLGGSVLLMGVGTVWLRRLAGFRG